MVERFTEFARTLEPAEAWSLAALSVVIGGAALWWGFRALKRARLLEDTPTSLIRSAAQGYCEFNGYAELMPGEPIRAPLTGTPCIWWEYSVEERVRTGRSRGWRVIEHDVSGALFALDDPTGRCIVDPDGAEVIESIKQVWHGGSQRPLLGPAAGSSWGFGQGFRYTERRIAPESRLLAIGFFETCADPHSSVDAQRALAQTLADWKRDQAALKARFDVDRDGQLDPAEWEAARRAAQTEVQTELATRALTPGVHLIREPKDGRPYILSALDQESLVNRKRWHARFSLLAALLCGSVAAGLIVSRGH